MSHLLPSCVVPSILALLLAAAPSGATPLAVADFQSGTGEGWQQTFGGVSVEADAGPAGMGDFALRAVPNPDRGRLFPSTVSNADFLGDLLGRGASELHFDALNPGDSPIPLELRAVFLSGRFERWVSLKSATVPNDGVWRSYRISLGEADVAHPLGFESFASGFGGVDQIGLRHQLLANQSGGSLLAIGNALLLDNIRLVPEPTTGLLLLAGLGGLGAASGRRP